MPLVLGLKKSLASEADKKAHKETRTDVHPIFNDIVRGKVESVHGHVFKDHMVDSAVLDNKETPFNFSTYVEEMAWEVSEGVMMGYKLPASARGIIHLPLGSALEGRLTPMQPQINMRDSEHFFR